MIVSMVAGFANAEEAKKDIKKELSEINGKIDTELGHAADKIEEARVKVKAKAKAKAKKTEK